MSRITTRRPRTVVLAALGISVLGLTACAPSSGADEAGADAAASFIAEEDHGKLADALPEDIRSKGALEFYVQQPNPPMEFTELENDVLVGVDPDLTQAIADLFGVQANYHRVTEFSELIPAVQTGRGDLVISAVSDLKSRQEVVSFVDYFSTGSQWVTAEDSEIEKVEDLCGKTVSTGSGTQFIDQIPAVSKEVCESQGKPPIETLTTVSVAEQMMMITNGRAVANLQGIESAGYLLQSEPDRWRTFGEPFERNLYGVVFNREDTALGEAVKQALDYMIEDGSYAEILEKWNVSDAAVDEAVINGATTG